VLVLRRNKVEHSHFRAPTALPVIGAVMCAYLATPLSGRASDDYEIAGWLMLTGVVLWACVWLVNRQLGKGNGGTNGTGRTNGTKGPGGEEPPAPAAVAAPALVPDPADGPADGSEAKATGEAAGETAAEPEGPASPGSSGKSSD
jgi:hypothetical protein